MKFKSIKIIVSQKQIKKLWLKFEVENSRNSERGEMRIICTSEMCSPSVACFSSTVSIVDLWSSSLSLHSSVSHLATHADAVSQLLMPRIQFTSHIDQVFSAPLEDVQLSSHVSCCCLNLTRWDFCNESKTLHSLWFTAKSEIIVSRSRHQNKMICRNSIDAARQTCKEHCRSRRSHSSLISILGFWLIVAARVHSQLFSCQITRSQLSNDLCSRD